MVTGATSPLTVDLSGRRVAISAGAGGIGRVMADSFATCGASLFVCDVDGAALASCPHSNMRADSGVVADCEAFVDAAAERLGGLDVLGWAANPGGNQGKGWSGEDLRKRNVGKNGRDDQPALFRSHQDIANMALYLASLFGATISGQAIAVDADLQVLV
jgi:hypothetical protein